jgi:hypothetical protein
VVRVEMVSPLQEITVAVAVVRVARLVTVAMAGTHGIQIQTEAVAEAGPQAVVVLVVRPPQVHQEALAVLYLEVLVALLHHLLHYLQQVQTATVAGVATKIANQAWVQLVLLTTAFIT